MGKRPAAAAREGLPMAAQRVRIIDIAQELGVSTATVSNVIHGKTKKISDQTVRRVQEALERRQYVPSMAGILLAQNSSRIVGAAVSGQGGTVTVLVAAEGDAQLSDETISSLSEQLNRLREPCTTVAVARAEVVPVRIDVEADRKSVV